MEDGGCQEERRTLAKATDPSELAVTFKRRSDAVVSTGDWRLVQGETLPSPVGGGDQRVAAAALGR